LTLARAGGDEGGRLAGFFRTIIVELAGKRALAQQGGKSVQQALVSGTSRYLGFHQIRSRSFSRMAGRPALARAIDPRPRRLQPRGGCASPSVTLNSFQGPVRQRHRAWRQARVRGTSMDPETSSG